MPPALRIAAGGMAMATHAILIISGVICLFLCGLLFYKLAPRDGEPPSAWTSTDTRGTAAALGLLVLLLAGISLVLKGIFS